MKKIMTWFAAAAFAAFGFTALAGLQEQVNTASDGTTLTMTADHDGALTISAAKTVNINMAGCKITGNVTTLNDGKLTFANGDLTYGSKFTGPGVVLKEGVRCAAFQQKSYVDSGMKMLAKKIDGATWYVVVKDETVEENDPIIVAERFSYYQGQKQDRMQYEDLATAFGNVMDDKTIQTVRLVRDVKENVTVTKTVIFDMDGKQLDGSITAANTGTVRTNWLQNVNMTGKLTAQGDLRIIMQGGTNSYNGSFSGNNIRLEEDTVFGYKQAKGYLADDMAMAKVEANRWQVVNTNRLEAAIGKLTDPYQTRQAFLSAEDAARLAGPEVDEDNPIHFLANRSDNIKLNQDEINKGLYFDPTNKNLGVSFTGVLEKADDVVGDYTMATTKDGYVFLTETDNIVAEIVESGKKFISVGAAFAVAENGQRINMLKDWSEGTVTQNGKTNLLSCAGGMLNAKLATVNYGRIEVLDGTESYEGAFQSGSDLKLCVGSIYGYRQSDDFLPVPHEEYAYAKIAANPGRWEVVSTNDVAVEIVRGGFVVDCFKTPEAAIEMAESGDTIRFRKAWSSDVFVNVEGLAKELKFDPGKGKFEQQEMRIWSDGYRLVQDDERLFTLKPLYDYVAVVAEGDPDCEMLCETFLDAMDYAVLVANVLGSYPEIKFLEDFPGEEFMLEGVAPDNIVVPEEYFDDALEFNPDGHEFPGKLIGDEDHFMAINARDNYVLATEDEIVATVSPHERGLFTDAAAAVRTAADEATVTIVKDTDVNVKAVSDITFQTAEGIVYRGLLDADGHSVETALGSVFGQNLINEFDWANSGDGSLTLKYDVEKGVYVVVPATVIVAEVRHVTDPVKRFSSVQDAFDWLRAYVDANPAEAINFCGIDVVKDGECTLDLGGKNLNWSINMEAADATVTVKNGVIAGNFTLAQGTKAGTLVLGQGVRMLDSQTAFQGGSANLIVKAGAYANDPTEFCEPGYVGALRAKPDLANRYVIYTNSEVQVSMTDGNGHVIHFKTLQDAFDLARSVISPLPNPAEIRLCNNLTDLNATNRADDANFVLIGDPNGENGPAMNVTGGRIVVEDGLLTVSNLSFNAAQIVVNGANGCIFTAGDDLEIKNATDGAVVVESGARMVVDGKNIQIWNNNGKNVVVRNPTTGLVLVRDDNTADSSEKSRIGIWCDNYRAGQQFGKVDPNFPYPMFCDGDISVETPDVYFTNDRAPKLHHGKGATIAGPADNAISGVRWTGGFKDVLEEGNFLISRTGNELVWLERQTPPVQDPDDSYVGSTKGTITLKVAKGNDYAFVTDGVVFTNWMSATGTYLTFEHLENSTTYTLLKRKSITKTQIVSDFIVNRADLIYRSEKYNAKEIAQLFDPSDITRFENEATKREVAENAAVVVTVAADGRGYVVTLKKDLHHGVDLWDDLGPVKIDLKGSYIDARTGGDEGILVKAAANYDDVFPTELDIVNSSGLGRIAKIVGAAGADGDATDANGKDGATGIRNESGNEVAVTVNGAVEVYGGKGGNGANRVNGQAGNGGAGGDAIKGVISLTVNGGELFGGNGGNGGESTNGTGGAGGNGGAGVGLDVTGTVVTGGIIGGNGGNGGGGATAGAGGNGGDGFVDLEKMVLDGDAFTGEIEVIAGKGGLSADPEKAGQDGKGGKPEAPAAPTVKYLTGESVTLNVEPSTEYLVFKTADGAPSIEKQTWIKTDPQETTIYVDRDTLNRKLVKDTEYTAWARTPAKDGNLVSYYSEMTFTTLGHDASDLVTLFKGKATAEEKDGIYVVTLTDDIKEGLEIPDNLGAFKLDMGGWSITGRKGNAAAGEPDGEAAITFTAANDDPSTLTRMIIVGNGDNMIVGGNGDSAIDSLDDADGDNGGEGGNGFAVADNLVKPVVVDFENGTLVGGNGGKGADSVNGNGGDGGNGGDAYDNIRLTVVIGRDALALGGVGGNGGNVYGGIAGNGGNGGNALQGEGGNAGGGGKARAQGGQDGQDGVGGDGIIPGGAPKAYHVKLSGANRADRFFATFEEGVLYAADGDTLTVIRDCVFDGDDYCEVEGVQANDFTVMTAPGVTLEWNGTLRVASGVTGFTVAADCNCSDASTGKVIVDGEATIEGGVIRNLDISFEGKTEVRGGTVGKVAIENGGSLTVPVNAQSVIEEGIVSDQGGFADKSGVFLFGGRYGFDPGLYRRDPFMVQEPKDVDGEHYRIVQDPKFTAMAQVGTKIWGIETIDEAFAEIKKANGPILVYLLKDSVANGVLSDQAWTDAVIIGNGYTIVDAREDAACEDALFNLSGNLVLRNVTFDGQGTQKGKFIELFEAKTVVMDGCKVTGYACEAMNGVDGKLQLISAAAAGMTTMLVLKDTTISGNDVSCAVSLTDRSGSGFEYQLLLSGATTITDNGGNGIVANKFGTIEMADDLTGGYIDVAYTGLADGKFGLAANKYLDGADHFRSEATKECGSVVEEGGKAYVKWGVDERQYAAKIGNKLYVTIEEALEAVQDGDTLVLEQNAEITRTVTVRLGDSNESFTLDLNGKTLTNSANKLKFGTGTVTIRNGTLAKNDTKYALYLYGAAVQLEDVTVDSDIYVARGWLVIGDEDVKVKGVIAKTNAGSISISEGLYTENPSEYVVSDRTVAAGSYGEYAWKVVPATETVGFADGFVLDTTPDKDGNIALDFTTRDTFGVLRDGAKVILNGYVVNKVSVETPKGWKSTVTYDPTNGKTVVLFSMDKKVLEPVLGTDDPGDRPFEVVTVGGQVTQVTLRVKNAVKGFWYQLMAANNLGEDFQVATEVQATQDGNLAITLSTTKDHFFKLNVSDRSATK